MLESEENKGTTFTIDIPVVYAKSVKTKDAESNRKNLSTSEGQFKHKAKILFVDDDKIACYYIKKVLNNLYKLDIVNSGDEALSSVKKNSYDILLIDINLGRGIDGLELMQTIKKLKNYSSTPVVAVTAYASKSDKDEFLSKGFTHYLSKPFTSSELKDLLAEILT